MRHSFLRISSARCIRARRLRLVCAAAMMTMAAAWVSAPPAHAELPERKSPLTDAPAVRQRTQLRKFRFEIGPGLTTTIGQDYYHAVMVSGKASFFLLDWLAIGGMIGHNLTPDMKTSFHERLEATLDVTRTPQTGRAPTRAEAALGMNKIGQVYAAQVELIPFSGKYGLFSGKFVANYDFYAFGGLGAINFKGDGPCMNPGSCPVTGMKTGFNFGVGIHTYINNFLSANLELRDILLKNNPSGRDVSGDRIADDDDLSLDSNYMIGLNFTFLLPPTARVSD